MTLSTLPVVQILNVEEPQNLQRIIFLDVPDSMKKVNKQCLLDTPRTVRVSEKTWQVIVQTSRL